MGDNFCLFVSFKDHHHNTLDMSINIPLSKAIKRVVTLQFGVD